MFEQCFAQYRTFEQYVHSIADVKAGCSLIKGRQVVCWLLLLECQLNTDISSLVPHCHKLSIYEIIFYYSYSVIVGKQTDYYSELSWYTGTVLLYYKQCCVN